MASLFSPVKKINDLHFNILKPGKLIKNAKVLRHGRLTVIVDENGAIYCDGLANGAYMLGNYHWLSGLLKAFCRLGIITKAEQAEHEAVAIAKSEKEDRSYAARELAKLLKENGLIPTKEQAKFIKDNPTRNGFI